MASDRYNVELTYEEAREAHWICTAAWMDAKKAAKAMRRLGLSRRRSVLDMAAAFRLRRRITEAVHGE